MTLTPHAFDYVYDLESYPNFFHACIKLCSTGQFWRFEISQWKDESKAFYQTLIALRMQGARMVGFNNLNYDYPMLHTIIGNNGFVTCEMLYERTKELISDHTGYKFMIWPDNRFVEQIDLLRIHHFDNHAKRTSLKMIEFNMRSDNIRDLPFPPGTVLTREQANIVIHYNDHDVNETEKFFMYTLSAIELREKLTKKYSRDFMNHNDTKIGKDYFRMVLEENGIPTKINGKPNQTRRESINVGEVILPYIKFERPEFNSLLDFFRNSTLTEKDEKGNLKLKGVLEKTEYIDGFPFKIGTGGLHASINNTIVSTSPTHTLFDVDIASNYPNIAIVNNFYPKHLTAKFCEIYLDVYNQRKSFSKDQPENGMLKLALNGVYGDSNQPHSFFYDPKYTLRVTINGQLLLLMLAEQLMKIPGLSMVQANTDGITYLCPNEFINHARNIQKWWEGLTKLELEEVEYKRMYIRDVNNYIAEKADGKLKRIGAYAYVRAAENPATREVVWNKDHSALVIPKAAEAALVRGVNIEQFIRNHTDVHDFMMRTKVPKSSYLELRKPVKWGGETVFTEKIRLQNISRYYPSLNGGTLVKVMPPTDRQVKEWKEGDHYIHKSTGAYKVVKPGKKPPSGMFVLASSSEKIYDRPDNPVSVEAQTDVSDCSDMKDFKIEDLNYEYYIRETHKIVDPLFSNQM